VKRTQRLAAARVPPPVVRRLRVLAFDPSLATRVASASFNEITVNVRWETLEPGPVGEYIEVVDVDPASRAFYYPVDLNHPYLLAEDGLSPSESNPQFHQQMVYAVAMTTIQHFERALGRKALWADRRWRTARGTYKRQFVRRLRIYPHALRDRNAYYSPAKKALLFGYFPVTSKDENNTPGTIVFTCLSHDIIAHETTHALLDGVHPRFNEPSNPDVHAFHEAFADIVALFQHFTYPTVLESQIRRTRGSLDSESLLGQLAQQFGRATGRGEALRDALGGKDGTGAWKPRTPDPNALDSTVGPHARGAILVAAVFRAFLLIYRARTADLFRIATQGTGKLPDGEIHPDLTARLAQEAARCADRVLQMCIRAIDYCPPVDITFGGFLRGIITADLDFAPDEKESFRIVFIESFREWGIYPRGISSMGVDALAWPTGTELVNELVADGSLQHHAADVRLQLGRFVVGAARNWNLESDRFGAWQEFERVRRSLWPWLRKGDSLGQDYARLFGLVIDNSAPATVSRGKGGQPAVEVHAVRPAVRRTVSGTSLADLVIEITQRRDGYFDEAVQQAMDAPSKNGRRPKRRPPDFNYRAGATILIDPITREIRRVIRTSGTIADDNELARVRAFLLGEEAGSGNSFDGGIAMSLSERANRDRDEPFALLHQLEEID
jgi:hypothetical protein